MTEHESSLDAARAAKEKIRELLIGFDEVRGLGLTSVGSRYAVKVNLSEQPENLSLPDDVDGVPVVIDVVGAIKPL
jgi:hypothetical protein